MKENDARQAERETLARQLREKVRDINEREGIPYPRIALSVGLSTQGIIDFSNGAASRMATLRRIEAWVRGRETNVSESPPTTARRVRGSRARKAIRLIEQPEKWKAFGGKPPPLQDRIAATIDRARRERWTDDEVEEFLAWIGNLLRVKGPLDEQAAGRSDSQTE